jgi:hypothetical protein
MTFLIVFAPLGREMGYSAFFFSRRFSSRSTADRTKSVLSSLPSRTAWMRSKVPSGNRACMSSAHRFFLPTRPGVTDTRFSVESILFLI